ncbi:NUDIX domain-containing protein [Lapillicoccus sp.]|uniref:NUDIX hydrolase n=1 Tax=Lapillicoccus sp. TaxID=1909287 RepID=UPI0025F84AED|nr:NUDIX domain-containing protein [Lapillicoccus sp.]
MTAKSSDQDIERVAQAELWVDGVARGGDVVAVRLGHGEHPEAALSARGWDAIRPVSVVGQRDPHVLRLVYDVRVSTEARPVPGVTRRDPDLVIAPGESAVPYQRIAAYAVVRSERGLLLSQFSHLTNAPGEWGLCGGGIDPGELPQEAVLREVWEESGQVVELTRLRTISSSHWIGRGPSGRLEDFQAVRIIFDATCADPTDPVVHDVGGTTERSAWVSDEELPGVALTQSWRTMLLGDGGPDARL